MRYSTNPYSYRLEVQLASGSLASYGTGWFVSPELIVTAFHVVGREPGGIWMHEVFHGTTYYLVGKEKVPLAPLIFDAQADVAVLKVCIPVDMPYVLKLANRPAEFRQSWQAPGYPSIADGVRISLTGSVIGIHENNPRCALQLQADQKTSLDWTGSSGSPICVNGEVIGVLLSGIAHTPFACAANVDAVRKLISRFDPESPEMEHPTDTGGHNMSSHNRTVSQEQIFEDVCTLLPVQFDVLMFKMGVPEAYMHGQEVPLAKRAVELVRWAKQQGQLERLRDTLIQIRNG